MNAGTWRMLLVGLAYATIGLVFAALDDVPDPAQMQMWRLGAWAVSALLAAGHLWYEHTRPGRSARSTALRAAGAVALGAFGLAVAANLHWWFSRIPGQRPPQPPLLALPIWPLVTGIPAFLAAFAVAAVLGRFSRRT